MKHETPDRPGRKSADPGGIQYRWTYLSNGKGKRMPRINETRDADCHLQLASLLRESGYRDPPEVLIGWKDQTDPPFAKTPGPGDVLCLFTRPPLSDPANRTDDEEQDGPRRHLYQAGSPLERSMFGVIRMYMSVCSRAHVALTPKILDHLPTRFKNRQSMEFHQNATASYLRLGAREVGAEAKLKTAAFLVRAEGVEPGGFDFFAAWAMSGPENLAWSRILATRCRDLARKNRFVLAELTCPWYGEEKPGQWFSRTKPPDLAWVDSVGVEVILALPLEARDARGAAAAT